MSETVQASIEIARTPREVFDYVSDAERLPRWQRDVDSAGFRQVAYEVAFVEYALALMTEEAHRDENMDPRDVLYDVRNTVNRVASRIPELLG